MLLTLQNTILEKIATGQPLAGTVDFLCREVENMADDIVCSVLLLDEESRLRHLAGPSLPADYIAAIDGTVIGPGLGSCGTAAYTGKPVVVEDIDTHAYWQHYKALALPLGLKACWSTPIIASGNVLGTFAFYYRNPRGPSDDEKEVVNACVHLCAIAIERDQRIAERRQLALTDSLTGLPNRTRFTEVITEIARKDKPWGLMLIDLDNLKMVNDTFGHAAGDDLLRVAAERLQAMVPGLTYRLGGDEFAVLVPCALTTEPAELASQLIEKLKEPATCAGYQIYPAATLGGARSNGDRSADQVRQNADYALYHAKERARGRYVEYAPGLGTSIVKRFRSVQDVELALREDRIEAYYQPVVELTTGRIMGFETLCRMITREGDVIAAGHFQEAMKDAHVALEITRIMLEKSAANCRRWIDRGHRFGRVGINLSAADFYRGGLTERMVNSFARHGVPTSRLVAEVTESVYMGQKDTVVAEEIRRMREAGIMVALDDFGTGFASLTHLLTVPVDIIKIDKCFVQQLAHTGAGAVIIKGLIEIANGLGIHVVAEGVEHEAQVEDLIALNCVGAQGFLYARAMDILATEGLLHAGEGYMTREQARRSRQSLAEAQAQGYLG